MNTWKIVRKRQLFGRFLFAYLVVLLVPLLFGTLFYFQAIAVIKEDVKHSNTSMLEQAKEVIDLKLAEIQRHAQSIASDPKVLNYQWLDNPLEGANMFKTVETRLDLERYYMENNFLVDYFLYFNQNDIVMNSTLTEKISKFYPDYLQYRGLGYKEWKQHILDTSQFQTYWPEMEVQWGGQTRSVITYLQLLGQSSKIRGVIVVLLNNNEIRSLFKGINLSDGGWAYIEDANGQLISSTTSDRMGTTGKQIKLESGDKRFFQRKIDSVNMYVTYTKSAQSGWTFVVAQPVHLIWNKVDSIRNVMVWLYVIALCTGGGLAVWMAYRNSKPFQKIVLKVAETITNTQLFSDPHSKRDIFDLVHDSFSNLLENNASLQSQIEEQLPLLQSAFFERLFSGELHNEDRIQFFLRQAGMAFDAPCYLTAIIHIHGYRDAISFDILKDLDVKKALVMQAIHAVLGKHIVFHDLKRNQVVMIVTPADKVTAINQELLESDLQQVITQLVQENAIQISISIGSVSEHLLSIPRSFDDARRVENARLSRAGGIAWVQDIPVNATQYYYPVETEMRILNMVGAGDVKALQQAVEHLYQENFVNRRLSNAMVHLLLYEIWGSVNKVVEQKELTDSQVLQKVRQAEGQVESMYKHHSYEVMYKELADILISCGSCVHDHKLSRNDRLIERITQFIHAHYSRHELSLAYVADKFHISEVYLSQFFKDQSGSNFSAYLETIRLTRAQEMLVSTELTIRDVADCVGYQSYDTFCRAFKRISGVSAGKYREQSR
jgi:two-component system response regulator YesN